MRIVFLIAIALVLVFAGISSAAEKQNAENLILKEMVALDKAFKTTIDAVVLNRLDKIVPAFEDAHRVREEVEKTVKGGKKIALPKNQERFKMFVGLDNRFHKEVEILIESAKKNHIGRVQKQTNRLLGLCVRCHAMFRK